MFRAHGEKQRCAFRIFRFSPHTQKIRLIAAQLIESVTFLHYSGARVEWSCHVIREARYRDIDMGGGQSRGEREVTVEQREEEDGRQPRIVVSGDAAAGGGT